MLGLMSPHKKIAALIIGGPAKESDEKEVDLKKEAELDAAKAVLKAIEKKDAQALVDSFKSFMECCAEEDEEQGEDKE